MRPDMRTREAKAAQVYMAHKGYPDARPCDVHKVEGQHVWYFYYDLPEGLLELEVEYREGSWEYTVCGFYQTEDRTLVSPGR